MQIDITANAMGTKFYNNDGVEIKGIQARAVNIDCSVNEMTVANVELALFASARVDVGELKYHYGGHDNVVGLLLDDGTKLMLPTNKD